MDERDFFLYILYTGKAIGIVFNREMICNGDEGIENFENYSIAIGNGEIISLKEYAEKIFFKDKIYVSFKLKKEINDRSKVKIYGGNIGLCKVTFLRSAEGEICDFCRGKEAIFQEENLSILDFSAEVIDRYKIKLKNKSKVLMCELKKEDFIFQVGDRIIEIEKIEKVKYDEFIFSFDRAISITPREEIYLKVKGEASILTSRDILKRPLKAGESLEIKNTVQPLLKAVSLVEENDDGMFLDLDFDCDMLKYSKRDFLVEVEGKRVKVKGESHYLKRGEEVLIFIEDAFIDIFNPDIYVKKINGDRCCALDYNYSKPEDGEFLKVKSFIALEGELEKGEFKIKWTEKLKSFESEIKCKWEGSSGKTILKLDSFGEIVFIGEEVEKGEGSIVIKGEEEILLIKEKGESLFDMSNFSYIYYLPGRAIKSDTGIKALRTTSAFIKVIKEEVNYTGPLEWGENFKNTGKTIYEDAIIEIDKTIPYRFYGREGVNTKFIKSLSIVAKEEFLEQVEVDFFSFICNKVILNLPLNIKLKFKDSTIEELERI